MSAAAASPSSGQVALRPLGRRTLAVQLAVLVAVEAVLFASYEHREAGFHWSTHFLVGLTAAALVLLVWLALTGAPARGQLMWVLGLHLLALFPDLLFTPGHQPHDEWMDIFLGHISVHYIPGGDGTWLLVALAASGAYCGVLSRWLAAGPQSRRGVLFRGRKRTIRRDCTPTSFGAPAEPSRSAGARRPEWPARARVAAPRAGAA